MATKKSSKRTSSSNKRSSRDERDERDNRDERDERDNRDADRGGRDRSRGRSNSNPDRVRLTGLWESKRQGLFTGGVKEVEALKDLCEQALADGKDIRIALFENDARSRRDPQFTVYASIDQGRQGGGSSYRGGSQGRSDNRDRGRDRIDDSRSGRDRDDNF